MMQDCIAPISTPSARVIPRQASREGTSGPCFCGVFMIVLQVKDFGKFQHYKDRNPPWIKFYNSVLDDYAFACLQDASKWHLCAIWLLASRSNNQIPDDAAWIARMIGATEPLDIDALVSAGFVYRYDTASGMLAERKQVAMPEKRQRERQSRGESEVKAYVNDNHGQVNEAFDAIWDAYPKRAGGNPKATALKAFNARLREGVDASEMLAGVERYASFVRATGKERTEYVKQAATFLGPDRHWAEPWDIPATAGDRRATAVTSMLEEWVNG